MDQEAERGELLLSKETGEDGMAGIVVGSVITRRGILCRIEITTIAMPHSGIPITVSPQDDLTPEIIGVSILEIAPIKEVFVKTVMGTDRMGPTTTTIIISKGGITIIAAMMETIAGEKRPTH